MFGKKNNELQSADYQYSVSGVENVTKKSAGKKIAAIAGVSAAVVIGGGAAAYTLSDAVKNQVRLRVMKSENYYAWVNERNSETLGGLISESYKKALDSYENGTEGNVRVVYFPSDEAKKDLIEDELYLDRDSADKDEQKLIGIIENTKEIALEADIAYKDTDASYNVTAEMDGEEIIGIDIAGDMKNMDYFMRIPQLSKRWIGADNTNGLIYGSASRWRDTLRDSVSPEELEEEINRYVKVWNDFADDVEIEKKEPVDICDIEVSYTVAVVELSEKDLDRLALEFMKELKDDDIIRDIAVNKLEIAEMDEYNEFIDSAIADLKADLEERDYDRETELTISTYIDGKGDIRGFCAETEDTQVFCAFGKDGDEVRGEYTVYDSDDEETSVKLYATEERKNTYSGRLDVTTVEYDYDRDIEDWIRKPVTTVIEFDDFEIVNEDKLYVSGEITVKNEEIDAFSFALSTDGDSQEIACDLRFDDKDYGMLVITYSFDEGADIDIPDKSEAYMIGGGNYFELKDYASKEEFESFINELLIKIGFDKETADETAKDAADEVYFEYDFDFDFDDFDFESIPDGEIDLDNFDFGDFDYDDFDFDFGDIDVSGGFDDYDFDFEDFEVVLDPEFSAGSFAR